MAKDFTDEIYFCDFKTGAPIVTEEFVNGKKLLTRTFIRTVPGEWIFCHNPFRLFFFLLRQSYFSNRKA